MRCITACFATLLIVVISVADAVTVQVPGDYPTVYEGMDAAVAGDTVLVAPGIYADRDTRLITMGGPPMPVTALCFAKADVVLRASVSGSSVLDIQAEPLDVGGIVFADQVGRFDVEGFVFRGSALDLAAITTVNVPLIRVSDCVFEAGGVAIASALANVELVDSHVRDCDAPMAAAVFANLGDLVVERCVFERVASSHALSLDGFGAGVYNATIRDCVFRNNEVSGVVLFNVAASTIENCLFVDQGGTAANVSGRDITIQDCSFVGSGLVTGLPFWGTVTRNSFDLCGTTAPGGAILVQGVTGPVGVTHNVVARTRGYFGADYTATGQWAGVGCNLYWDNTVGDGSPTWPLAASDVFADPQFCLPDAREDLSVAKGSPCLAGNTPGCTQLGSWGEGCSSVSVESLSWGSIKSRFLGGSE